MRFLIAHGGNLQDSEVLKKIPEYGVWDIANTAESFYDRVFENGYDYVVIASDFSRISPIDLCRDLKKEHSRTIVTYVAADPSPQEKITFLDSGFDLYVPANYSAEELKAELMVLSRRDRACPHTNCIYFKGFCLKPDCKMLYFGDAPVCLRRKEYELLEYMALNIGRILTKEILLEHAWSEGTDVVSNTLDVHIRSLRVKMANYTSECVIETKRGYGYILFP